MTAVDERRSPRWREVGRVRTRRRVRDRSRGAMLRGRERERRCRRACVSEGGRCVRGCGHVGRSVGRARVEGKRGRRRVRGRRGRIGRRAAVSVAGEGGSDRGLTRGERPALEGRTTSRDDGPNAREGAPDAEATIGRSEGGRGGCSSRRGRDGAGEGEGRERVFARPRREPMQRLGPQLEEETK